MSDYLANFNIQDYLYPAIRQVLLSVHTYSLLCDMTDISISTQVHANFLKLKILLYTASLPNLVKFGLFQSRCFFCFFLAKTLFPKTSKSKRSFIQSPLKEPVDLSRVNDHLWLSQNVCICGGFCNFLGQRFMHFWPTVLFLEKGNLI